MKKSLYILGIVILIAFGGWYFFLHSDENVKKEYTFAEITRGNLETVVSSTGTLSAVGTVEVGTQVSGTIDKIYVDFNSKVKAGELLAVLDTTFLSAAVRDARAGLVRSQSQYDQQKAVFDNSKQLFDKGIISELDYISAKTSLDVAKSNLQSAQSALDRSITNLRYAVIRAPIDGTIINRNIERGQTVAASFSTPTLFTIAEDLAKMEILAQVDESDIGQIQVGQIARFTVQAYPDKKFEGTVTQIRLQPETVQNVVNYTVVVEARNNDHILLPGMTATIDFLVEEKDNVLLVPNLALRFIPTDEMTAELQKKREKEMANLPDSVKNRFGGGQRGGGQGGGFSPEAMQRFQQRMGGGNGMPKMAQLWYLDDKNELTASRVILGSTDGKNTEIVRGRNIKEGMKIITAVTGSNNAQRSANPLTGMGRRPF